MKIVVCLMLVFAALLAADTSVAGKWSGTFLMDNGSGESHDSSILLVLKQEGSAITGTAGPNENEQWPISKGKIDGNKLTMEVQSDGPLIQFELVLDGDHLKGDAHASHEGHNLTAKVDAARSK